MERFGRQGKVSKQAQGWWSASRALGFELRDDTNGNTVPPVWDTMVASLRPHTQLSEHNWMVGAVDGLSAMVTYYFRDGGSSSDTHYTYAMVQLDPPLFLGLHLSKRTWLCGVPKIGVPLFDDRLYVQSFQPERGHAMVWPGRNPPLADHALSAVARGMNPDAYDTFAATTVSRFEANPTVLQEMLTRASALARAAGERRQAIGETRDEALGRDAWAQFAERERFTFDVPRRTLRGNFQGFEAHVLTRSSPMAMWNQILLSLPTDTGMSVDVAPESGFTRFANVIGFSDIEVGDAAFDRALRLKGSPAPLVRAFFARPETRAQALALVEKYGRFAVLGRFLSLALPRTCTNEAELRALLTDVATMAAAATGKAAPRQGPYRG